MKRNRRLIAQAARPKEPGNSPKFCVFFCRRRAANRQAKKKNKNFGSLSTFARAQRPRALTSSSRPFSNFATFSWQNWEKRGRGRRFHRQLASLCPPPTASWSGGRESSAVAGSQAEASGGGKEIRPGRRFSFAFFFLNLQRKDGQGLNLFPGLRPLGPANYPLPAGNKKLTKEKRRKSRMSVGPLPTARLFPLFFIFCLVAGG